jgi:hypothetical protein
MGYIKICWWLGTMSEFKKKIATFKIAYITERYMTSSHEVFWHIVTTWQWIHFLILKEAYVAFCQRSSGRRVESCVKYAKKNKSSTYPSYLSQCNQQCIIFHSFVNERGSRLDHSLSKRIAIWECWNKNQISFKAILLRDHKIGKHQSLLR